MLIYFDFIADKTLPKAMVKPNILTHVIEGYVIQEAGEPFAVSLIDYYKKIDYYSICY